MRLRPSRRLSGRPHLVGTRPGQVCVQLWSVRCDDGNRVTDYQLPESVTFSSCLKLRPVAAYWPLAGASTGSFMLGRGAVGRTPLPLELPVEARRGRLAQR
jgi:hypothetical protein